MKKRIFNAMFAAALSASLAVSQLSAPVALAAEDEAAEGVAEEQVDVNSDEGSDNLNYVVDDEDDFDDIDDDDYDDGEDEDDPDDGEDYGDGDDEDDPDDGEDYGDGDDEDDPDDGEDYGDGDDEDNPDDGDDYEEPEEPSDPITPNYEVALDNAKIVLGEETCAEVSYDDEDTGIPEDLSFSSSDESVATIDDGGYIEAVGVGTTEITISNEASDEYEEYSASATLYVVPGAPAKISYTADYSQIKITWSRVPGATRYKLYKDKKLYKTIESTSKTISVVDKSVAAGKSYRYYVVASGGSDDLDSVPSNSITAKLKVLVLSKPKSIKAKNTAAKKIDVSWPAGTGAKSYKVQYATNAKFSKATTKAAKTTKLTIAGLKKGTTYYVRVCSVNGTKTSAWTSAAKVKVVK